MIKDLGGFVGIVGTVGDFQKLFSEWHIDVRSDVCELSMIIDGYIKKLFIKHLHPFSVLYKTEYLCLDALTIFFYKKILPPFPEEG